MSKKKKKKYYVVKHGREEGIYHTWDECKEQVNGFPNARFKSFDTLKGVGEYLCDCNKNKDDINLSDEQVSEITWLIQEICNQAEGNNLIKSYLGNLCDVLELKMVL